MMLPPEVTLSVNQAKVVPISIEIETTRANALSISDFLVLFIAFFSFNLMVYDAGVCCVTLNKPYISLVETIVLMLPSASRYLT